MNRKHYSKPVRELVHYRGSPDPLRGDSLNQKVRDTARETAEALADQSPQREMNTVRAPTRGRIEGFGSGTGMNHSVSWEDDQQHNSREHMEGFGRDGQRAFVEKRPSTLSSGLSSIKEWGAGLRSSQISKWKTGSSLTGQSYSDEPSVGTSYRPNTMYARVAPVSSAQSGTAADGLVEKQIVESICATGGVRLEPTPEVTKRFNNSLNSLDPTGVKFVLEALDIKVTSESPTVAYRALFAIEQSIQPGAKHKDMFCKHYVEYPDLILQHRNSRNASLQELSKHVAVALGLDSDAAASGSRPNPATEAEVGDLLGDFGADQSVERNESPVSDLLSLDVPLNEPQLKPTASRESVTSVLKTSEHPSVPPSHEIADLLGQLTTERPGTGAEVQATDQVSQASATDAMQGAEREVSLPNRNLPYPPPSQQIPGTFLQVGAQVPSPAMPGMVAFPPNTAQTGGQFGNPSGFNPYQGAPVGPLPGMANQSAIGMQFYQQNAGPYAGQTSYAQGYQFNSQASAIFYPQNYQPSDSAQPYIPPEYSSNGNNAKGTEKMKKRSADSIPEFDFISQHMQSEIKKS